MFSAAAPSGLLVDGSIADEPGKPAYQRSGSGAGKWTDSYGEHATCSTSSVVQNCDLGTAVEWAIAGWAMARYC